MTIVVKEFCDDADITNIMRVREKKALYAWGIINYEDALGDQHYTRFCQLLNWTAVRVAPGRTEERVNGIYPKQHNDAD
jgi:hypothetical protein